MTWSLDYSNRARHDLRSLDPPVARRVLQALERLAQTGQGDLRHITGQSQELRLRVGEWRVRLTFETETHTIHIYRIRHRREAYRDQS